MNQLTTEFEQAVTRSKQLVSRPDNATLLRLYSLYKQATEGDVTDASVPGMFDFVAKAKQDAWLQLKGITTTNAMIQYVNLVAQLSE